MNLPAQFITWKSVPQEGAKPRKVPCHPVTLENIDHLNPANWMTEAQARATGLNVGFVLTQNDPYFLLDIDDCRDPLTGAWDNDSQAAAALFPGAFMEISVSGTGLHVMGICDQQLPKTRRNRWGGKYEFYTSGRFVAMGSNGTGSINTDCTAALFNWLPVRPDPMLTGIPETGPVPEWSGHTDDLLLIQQALDARGSINVQFGARAPFRALWTGDEAILAKHYPTSTDGQAFDRSAADAALVMLLGFWTGKDAARVERLWRAAPLTQGRKKLDRDDYVHRTIYDSLGRVTSVYKRDEKAAPLPLPLPGTEGAPLPMLALPGTDGEIPGGYLTIFEQITLFEGCVYIEEDHAILCPDGIMLTKERFSVRYGGYEFQMQSDGTKPSRDAWEAFTQNRCRKFPRVKRRRFFPNRPFGEIIEDEVNCFIPANVVKTDGDVSMFTTLVQTMIPNPNDRDILLSWFAAMVQYPGRKFQWAVVIQGAEGNGKTFLLKCMEYAVGQSLTHLPNPEDMNEKYNSYVEGNLLIGVEEIHMDGRRDILDRLKKYITNSRVEVRRMGTDKAMADNLTNWIFLTNYKNAVVKTRGDRRYAIFFSAQQEAEDVYRDYQRYPRFFPTLWDWARAGGFAAIAGYLSRYPINPAYNPAEGCHRAPETSSTGEAVTASYGVVEQFLIDAIESEIPGFRGGWISSARARDYLDSKRKNIGNNALSDALKTIGYFPCPSWPAGRSPTLLHEEGGRRPVIYCTKAVAARLPTIGDYLQAQDYRIPVLKAVGSH